MARKSKTKTCHRCDVAIQPELESHATFTVKIRECDGTGRWVQDTYPPMTLCATCWGLLDAAMEREDEG